LYDACRIKRLVLKARTAYYRLVKHLDRSVGVDSAHARDAPDEQCESVHALQAPSDTLLCQEASVCAFFCGVDSVRMGLGGVMEEEYS
jgi:hypothetical protein